MGIHYSNLIEDSILDKDLQEYYEARFDMMSSKGWKDLQVDIEKGKSNRRKKQFTGNTEFRRTKFS
jgi:hypothetical protein